MERDPGLLPRPTQDLAVYVREAVWTDAALLDLVGHHDLYASRRGEPRAALESFRRDIDVDVHQNYFAQERSTSDPPRSARLVIRFRSTNPDEAMAVTRALASLVVNGELESRAEQAARAQERVAADLAQARQAQRALTLAVSAKQRATSLAPSARLQVEIVTMLGSLETLELQTSILERREAVLSFGAAVEQQRLGLRFTVVDDGSVPLTSARDHLRLALVAVVALLLGLPLVALGVGAARMPQGVA
jgi:hypothetical protein